MSLLIRADSDLELAQLAELLLSKYNIEKANSCTDCGDSANLSTIVTSIGTGQPYYRITFTVGYTNAPQAGDTQVILKDLDGKHLGDVDLDIWVEGSYKYPVRHYSYDPATGKLIFTSPLGQNQSVMIKAVPMVIGTQNITIGSPSTGTSGFPFIFPYTLS